MPIYTVSLTDAQAVAAAAIVGDVGTWLQTNVTTMAKTCIDQITEKSLLTIGVRGIRDLTAADIAAIKSARGL